MRTLFIFLIIIICSCGRKSTNEIGKEGSVIKIDLLSEPESEITNVSDIATDIAYIPLQTTEHSLLKSVSRVVTCNDKIYIRNGYTDILCFDRSGKIFSRFLVTCIMNIIWAENLIRYSQA